MYVLLAAFIYFNRKNKYIVLMGLGFLLNAIPIFLNGGAMPVSAKAAETAGLTLNMSKEGLYTLINENTRDMVFRRYYSSNFLKAFCHKYRRHYCSGRTYVIYNYGNEENS